MPSREVIAGLMTSGRQAMTQGRLDRAIMLFRRIGDSYPDAPERPEAIVLLAQALEAHGDSTLALSEYRRLIEQFPQLPQAQLARTKVLELERLAGIPSSSTGGPVARYIPVSRIDDLDERELLRLRHAGTDTVVVEVARQALSRSERSLAGVYFKTDWAPVIQDRFTGVAASAHRHQIQVWAALSIRRMDWIEPRLGWSDRRYYPASAELVPTGTLDLMHPAVWEYLFGLLMDLAATGVDGILLMLEPPSAPADGFSSFALRAYQRDMGQAIDPARLYVKGQQAYSFAPEFWRWVGWKQREQRKAVDGVVRALRKSYPKLRLALELHTEAITNPRQALAWYAEDFLDLRHSQMDYIAIALASGEAGLIKPLMEGMNGKRLLLTTDSGSFSRAMLSSFPRGSGLIYKDKVPAAGLTKEGR